ncbi:MAG: transposase family protein [Candidatus Riflebacteria bacterium]|nr:transposase family protein [Candidatus Riflebacteria bacterium]
MDRYQATSVLSGMQSFGAIAQWGKELPREDRDRLGCTRHTPPDKKTYRRVLADLNAEEISVCSSGRRVSGRARPCSGSEEVHEA